MQLLQIGNDMQVIGSVDELIELTRRLVREDREATIKELKKEKPVVMELPTWMSTEDALKELNIKSLQGLHTYYEREHKSGKIKMRKPGKAYQWLIIK